MAKKNKKQKMVAPLEIETRSAYDGPTFSMGDLALAQWLGISSRSHAGVSVTEASALGIPAVFRSISLLSGTIASLSLKSYRTNKIGDREEITTFLDNPHPDMTQFEWVRLVVTHHVFRGNAYLLHMYNGAGAIAGLQPIHPGCVTVYWDDDKQQKVFKVSIEGETREYTSADILHIPGMSMDGLVGVDPLTVLRETFGTAIASEEARSRQLANGGMIAGIVSCEEATTEEEATVIKSDLRVRVQGTSNAGDIAFVNRSLTFTPWMMTNDDAQFVETLTFQVEELARAFGLPKQLLMLDGASTWGSGVKELLLYFQKTTLVPITKAIEQRCSLLLSRPTICEFDYKSLFKGTPREELEMLIMQKGAGILSLNEVRSIINLPPVDGGDTFVITPPSPTPASPVQPPQGVQ